MRVVTVTSALSMIGSLLGTVPLARAEAETPAAGSALNPSEATRLSRGETVVRQQTWEPDSTRYVGGVTYTIVDAAPAEISALLDDVEAYRRLLPRTKRARLVGIEPGGDRLIELVSGTALVEVEYTIRVRKQLDTGGRREVRFWLEPSRPHDIDDAWGYFRLEPFVSGSGEPHVLLTYAILADVGPGIVRELFEERVRAALLSVPQLVRRSLAEARRSFH